MTNKLEKTIISAISLASITYGKMSGGKCLSHAPEYVLNVEIGRQIASALGHVVSFEAPLSELLADSDCGEQRTRQGKKMRSRQFDIAIRDKQTKKIVQVIELKKVRTGAQWAVERDLEGIRFALDYAHSLSAGYLLIYSKPRALKDGTKKKLKTVPESPEADPVSLRKGQTRRYTNKN